MSSSNEVCELIFLDGYVREDDDGIFLMSNMDTEFLTLTSRNFTTRCYWQAGVTYQSCAGPVQLNHSVAKVFTRDGREACYLVFGPNDNSKDANLNILFYFKQERGAYKRCLLEDRTIYTVKVSDKTYHAIKGEPVLIEILPVTKSENSSIILPAPKPIKGLSRLRHFFSGSRSSSPSSSSPSPDSSRENKNNNSGYQITQNGKHS